jgi:SAM-dependent methyltransferase
MTDAASTPRPADTWRELLRRSAVPQAVIDAGPEADVTLAPERFRWKPDEDARQPLRPSRRRALEALPEGGSVLDVGVGGGASSLGLVPKVGLIVGVDPMEGMLESFRAGAREAGVATRVVLGSWPDVAGEVGAADIAVCHHVVYRVAEIEDFVAALTEHARRRVVIEISDRSPLSALDPLWKSIHGLDRPDWSVADELQGVLVAMGVGVEREDMLLPPRAQEVTPELVEFSRRRLYVGAERDREIEQWLRAREPREHRVVALWWPGTG